MDNVENSFTSHLRPPSKIPSSSGRGLMDITVSANNARPTSMMPPPPSTTLKHKGNGLAEPTAKRRTLAERAGETQPVAPTPSISRMANPPMKCTTLAGAYRNPSFSSSVSSRTPSISSRNTSGSSFASSLGPGASRPQSAMGNRGPLQASTTTSRPASSLENHTAGPTMKRKAWDTKGRLEDMETLYSQLTEQMNGTTNECNALKETVPLYKTRINELDTVRLQLSTQNATLNADLTTTRSELSIANTALDDLRRTHANEVEALQRERRADHEAARKEHREELDRLLRAHGEEMSDLKRRLNTELEDERSRRIREIQEITTQSSLSRQRADVDVETKEREIRMVKGELQQVTADLERERNLNRDLRGNLSESANNTLTIETSMRSLKARIEYLESDSKSQSEAFGDLQQQLKDAIASAQEANSKLRTEETLRRKLHNQVQELKGNIRVFCRVRPHLEFEPTEDRAKISYPDDKEDSKEVEVMGPEEKSSLGNITTKTNAFTFDRVFGPTSQNVNVFEEISQLVQSALDGYNVCIFCYGQTGSGKTYTMSSTDGMIPRAVHQIYDTAQALSDKGWTYRMEGSFVEVYNENLNDLLGRPEEFDKKKHDIRHDMARAKTTITDITTVELDSPAKVESILRRATANRSVAATKANERSSRSHSVFILRLTGENVTTGEKSEGTLNLVDLAGSERLSHSGSTGERLKETQNINRSLSCLGDVIGALGQGKEGGHVPYRNSKLTYLLQFSLGGNSKTLMFVMISPLQAHLSETLTSLKFATKVHNTHIGTATAAKRAGKDRG